MRSRGITYGAGERKLKNTLRALGGGLCESVKWDVGRGVHLLTMQSNSPTNHIRIVNAGISGSSTLDTDARTSGNGLSSSSIASKSNSILLTEGEGEGQQVSEGCGDDMSARVKKARRQAGRCITDRDAKVWWIHWGTRSTSDWLHVKLPVARRCKEDEKLGEKWQLDRHVRRTSREKWEMKLKQNAHFIEPSVSSSSTILGVMLRDSAKEESAIFECDLLLTPASMSLSFSPIRPPGKDTRTSRDSIVGAA